MKALHFDLMEELGNPLLNKSLTRGRKYSLEEDIKLYIEIRARHPEAISSTWMRKNGYNSLYARVRTKHKVSWNSFRELCGFNEFNRMKKYTLEDNIKEYIKIRGENQESESSGWMLRNGYNSLYTRVTKNRTWHEFKLLCGFNDFDFAIKYTSEDNIKEYVKIRNEHSEAESSSWVQMNGYKKLYERATKNRTWHEFKLLCGFNDFDVTKLRTLEDNIKEYIEIRKKHPEDSKSSYWMEKNKYGYLTQRIRKGHSWKEFKKLAGFND
jgi:glutaredoxin-related protein